MEDQTKYPIFCPMITPTDHGGGIKSTISLLNGLQSLGHQVTVVVPKHCSYLTKLHPNSTVLFFESNPKIALMKPLSYIQLCLWIKGQFKKFHKNTCYLCSDRPALMLALFLPKTTSLMYVSRGWFYTNWSARYLRWLLFPKVNVFVGISQKQFELMQRYALPKAKVYLVENGFTLNSTPYIPFQNECIQLALIGGICERKNQAQAIALIQLLKEQYPVKLLIYGLPTSIEDRKYQLKIEHLIAQNHLEDYIEFRGYETNLDHIYQQVDIVLSTATEEGFGRTLIEAMSYGIPVIASASSGGPSMIISHLSNGLLYDGSLRDLVAKTSLLIGDYTLRSNIITKALAQVKSNYSEQLMAEKYSNIIEYGITKD